MLNASRNASVAFLMSWVDQAVRSVARDVDAGLLDPGLLNMYVHDSDSTDLDGCVRFVCEKFIGVF
jgi:hypothetical protein